MSDLIVRLCLVIVLFAGWLIKPSPGFLQTAKPPLATAVATADIYMASDCSVTQPIKDEPPKDPRADRFGIGFWYVNADHTMWVNSLPWRAGRGDKVIWIRPRGTQLKVSGRRLDGEAPPLRVQIPCCYPTGFQVTGMAFPTEGCWLVTAKAGQSRLRFVTKVMPAE